MFFLFLISSCCAAQSSAWEVLLDKYKDSTFHSAVKSLEKYAPDVLFRAQTVASFGQSEIGAQRLLLCNIDHLSKETLSILSKQLPWKVKGSVGRILEDIILSVQFPTPSAKKSIQNRLAIGIKVVMKSQTKSHTESEWEAIDLNEYVTLKKKMEALLALAELTETNAESKKLFNILIDDENLDEKRLLYMRLIKEFELAMSKFTSLLESADTDMASTNEALESNASQENKELQQLAQSLRLKLDSFKQTEERLNVLNKKYDLLQRMIGFFDEWRAELINIPSGKDMSLILETSDKFLFLLDSLNQFQRLSIDQINELQKRYS